MALAVVFYLFVLIFSVVIHEISHGFVAERLGDPTARLMGRLTLNPVHHFDLMGSLIVPLVSYYLFGFPIGWAKPVPYNPLNLQDPVRGGAKIAVAGPLSNLALAAVFGTIVRILVAVGQAGNPLVIFFSLIAGVNVALAIFNLVPIPPLDGSKVLFALLPRTAMGNDIGLFLERYGFVILIFFIMFGFEIIEPVIRAVYALLTGQPFGF